MAGSSPAQTGLGLPGWQQGAPARNPRECLHQWACRPTQPACRDSIVAEGHSRGVCDLHLCSASSAAVTGAVTGDSLAVTPDSGGTDSGAHRQACPPGGCTPRGYHGITLPPAPDPKKKQSLVERQVESPIAATNHRPECPEAALRKAPSPPLGRPQRKFACVSGVRPRFQGQYTTYTPLLLWRHYCDRDPSSRPFCPKVAQLAVSCLIQQAQVRVEY